MQRILGLSLVVIFLWGCNKVDEKAGIVGIWRVKSSAVDGREIGDGKGWFDFKADGTVDTRPRPGAYDSGNYTLTPENHLLKLFSEDGSMDYTYELNGDALLMKAVLPTGASLVLDCERVSDYPVTKETDVAPDALMKQPG